jgi:tRNA G18 (ribose-2'-O)-methylase SpoU
MHFHSVLTSRRWLQRLESALAATDVDVLVADESLLQDITGYRVHRGALAVVSRPDTIDVDEVLCTDNDVLVLEDLVDPTNVGLAIRSAVVQGISDVILSPGCADPLYRRAVKSSMGAVLRCRFARSDAWPVTLAALAQSRLVVALTPEASDTVEVALADASSAPVALLVGSEGPGLSAMALASSWRRARIPMSTAEDSLNVAAATAVACYARAQSRRNP